MSRPKRKRIVCTIEIPELRRTWRLDLVDLQGLASLCYPDGFGRDLAEAIEELEELRRIEEEEEA